MCCSPYRPMSLCAAGPVSGAGPPTLAHPPRPHADVQHVPLLADGSHGGPRIARTDRLPCHPLRQAWASWLHHGLVATRPDGLADSLGASLLLDMNLVVVGELAHRRSQDRGRRDPEPAQREALHVGSEFIEPREVRVSPES